MKRPNRLALVGFLSLASVLSGGCIDAVGEGIADGVFEGLSSVVAALIEQALADVGGGA